MFTFLFAPIGPSPRPPTVHCFQLALLPQRSTRRRAPRAGFYECMARTVGQCDDPRLQSAAALRGLVAERLTPELLETYRVYADAGLPDFSFMKRRSAPQTIEEFRDFARRSGKARPHSRHRWVGLPRMYMPCKGGTVRQEISADSRWRRRVGRSQRSRFIRTRIPS